MISGTLIVCALLLALIEKPHLFQKPISAWKVTVVAILIITAVFSFVSDSDDDIKRDKAARTIDSLQREVSFQSRLIDTFRKEERLAEARYDKRLHVHDSNTVAIMAKYGYKVDTLAGTIEKFDKAIIKEIPPTLAILEQPIIVGPENDKSIQYQLKAMNADAHLLVLREITISISPAGRLIEKSVSQYLSNAINYTSIIPAGSSMLVHKRMITIGYSADSLPLTNDFLFVIECLYKSKSNKKQVPIRKIYFVSLNEQYVREVGSELHYSVSLLLKKKRIWPKFYDL